MTLERTRRPIVIGLVLLWIAMLFAPVVTLQMPGGGFSVKEGAWIFGQGWLGPLDLQFGWFANPLFAGVLYVILKGGGSESGISSMALGLMLLLPTLNALAWRDVLFDEGGGRAPILDYHYGYYGWLTEMMAVAAIAVMAGLRRYRSRQQAERL